MSDGPTDAALLSAIRDGDADALGVLYDRYGRLVFAVVYRVIGAREAAEEVTQDVFHGIWRRAGTYREDRGAPRGWVLTIARNAAIDWRRSKATRLAREASIEDAGDLSADRGVEDEVAVRLRDGRVRDAVTALSPEQRLVLDLAFWRGLSQSEIAARTGIPLGTVKSRVRLAMIKLRDGLAEEAGS